MSDRAGKMLRTTWKGSARCVCATWTRRRPTSWRLAKELAAQGAIEIAESKDEEMVY